MIPLGLTIGALLGLLLVALKKNRPAASSPPEPPPVNGADDQGISEFVQARNYKPADRGGKDAAPIWVVLHSVEGAAVPKAGDAMAVARLFAGPNAPEASTHYAADPATLVQMVRERDIAWAAPGANDLGIHIELAGRAMETAWGANSALEELKRAAELVARICRRWGIPTEAVDAQGILDGRSGITLHSHVTDATNAARLIRPEARTPLQAHLASAHGKHQDPGGPRGARWPMDSFLALVRAAA